MSTLLQGYIRTALWSSNDESDDTGGEPLDKNYSESDLAPECLASMKADCERFASENEATLASLEGFDDEQIGHDFWLTRVGHGAGFWDGDYPEPQASKLTQASKGFGEVNLYVGDDGKIHS